MSVSPPRPKGPPLNALRAFEAAARLGGFTAAASELSVTPGAVAQHIKALEEWLGAPLFERRSQGVVLTGLGQSALDDFATAFDQLGEAVQKLRNRAGLSEIRIAALPSVAQLWLSPRLPRIRDAVPDISISVTALEAPPNLQREPFDLSVFYVREPASRHAIVIARDTIFPVCAPGLAARIHTLSDLSHLSLLHDAAWRDDWGDWLAGAGGDRGLAEAGPVYSLYSLALEEARNGAGVLVGHEALVEAHLRRGELVAPFAKTVTTPRFLVMETAVDRDESPLLDSIVESLCPAVAD